MSKREAPIHRDSPAKKMKAEKDEEKELVEIADVEETLMKVMEMNEDDEMLMVDVTVNVDDLDKSLKENKEFIDGLSKITEDLVLNELVRPGFRDRVKDCVANVEKLTKLIATVRKQLRHLGDDAQKVVDAYGLWMSIHETA